MVALTRRINAFGIEHPWRFAAASFLFFFLLSVVVSVVTGHKLFTGLFGAYGGMVGAAYGISARRKGRRMPFWQKALWVPLVVGGFLVLSWTLQVAGLVPR